MSLHHFLDQETFRSSRRSIQLQRSSRSQLKVYPITYNQKAGLFGCTPQLPYRLEIRQDGVLQTLLITEWYDALDYDPFEEEQGKDISGFTWEYYGWADIGNRTVCGNRSVTVPRLAIHELQDNGEFLPGY